MRPDHINRNHRVAIARYIEFVIAGKNQPSPWESLTNQIFLGSETFITKVRKHIPKDKDLSEIPQIQKHPIAKPLKYFSEKAKNRDVAIINAFESGGYSMKEIGDHFELHYSTASRIVRRKEEFARNN